MRHKWDEVQMIGVFSAVSDLALRMGVRGEAFKSVPLRLVAWLLREATG